MAWIELHISTTGSQTSELSDELLGFGAQAVTFLDEGNQPLYEPSNSTPRVWDETKIIALFSKEYDMSSVLAYCDEQTKNGLVQTIQLKEVPNQDWVRLSLEGFKPIRFGQHLWICPSWDMPPEPEGTSVILDPGLAFGTGTHPTTALCLEWLEKNKPTGRIIDYGCGSGILGIAALKLGAIEVFAVDHDLQALESTENNAKKNNLPIHVLKTYQPFDLPAEIKADVVIANILAQPLIELAPQLAVQTNISGKIVLSGVLINQVLDIISAYQPWYDFQEIVFKGEWACLVGIRSNNN